MKHLITAVAATCLLAGCAGNPKQGGLLGLGHPVSETMRGNYAALADCSYQLIDEHNNDPLLKEDFASQRRSQITARNDILQARWRVSFTQLSSGMTRVDVQSFISMWGTGTSDTFLLPDVRTCSARLSG